MQNFCGFVEELVINDDPEYKLIDKIRAPRTSNEARQKLFSQLSGELQRRMGLKVLELNANCVLGYIQYFDLEGEHGIVVRGIGTAAIIIKQSFSSPNASSLINTNSPHNIQQHTILQHQMSVNPQYLNDNIQINQQLTNINLKLKKPSPTRYVGQQATPSTSFISHNTNMITAPAVNNVNNTTTNAIKIGVSNTNNNLNSNSVLLQRVHSDPNLSLSANTNQLVLIPATAPIQGKLLVICFNLNSIPS